MRHIRPLAVAGVGMMAVVGCIGFIPAKSNAQAELPKEPAIGLGGGVKMEFVLIQPGSFTRGRSTAAHKVTLTKPLYLGKYEVTLG